MRGPARGDELHYPLRLIRREARERRAAASAKRGLDVCSPDRASSATSLAGRRATGVWEKRPLWGTRKGEHIWT